MKSFCKLQVKRHKERLTTQIGAQLSHRSSNSKSDADFGNQKWILPLFAPRVFVQTAQECNVEVLLSFREADALIAAMANELKCPVVSDDGDFYVYDLKYGR